MRRKYSSVKITDFKPYLLDRIKVDSNSCWVWQLSCESSGYGSVSLKYSTQKKAHRLSYEIFNGPITDNLYVLHICDNKKCINPEHLFLGTPKENSENMSKKGRHHNVKGENNPGFTLLDKEIRAIRIAYQLRLLTQAEIARLYDTSFSHIHRITRYKCRTDV